MVDVEVGGGSVASVKTIVAEARPCSPAARIPPQISDEAMKP